MGRPVTGSRSRLGGCHVNGRTQGKVILSVFSDCSGQAVQYVLSITKTAAARHYCDGSCFTMLARNPPGTAGCLPVAPPSGANEGGNLLYCCAATATSAFDRRHAGPR